MNHQRFLQPLIAGCVCFLSACATQPPPGEVMKYMEQAERAYDTQNWRMAEDGYRELARLVPQDAYAYFRLGNTLARQRRLDEAAAAYQEALIRDTGFAKAYNNLGMIRLLQAEVALNASVAKATGGGAGADNAAKMLKEVRRITNIPVQEVDPPLSRRGKKATQSPHARIGLK